MALQEFFSFHFDDAEGNPGGGHSNAQGIQIAWQNGPLGRGENRQEPNGAFVETVIAMAGDRLVYYQGGEFACEENAKAIEHLRDALKALKSRTADREKRGVEGTHEK